MGGRDADDAGTGADGEPAEQISVVLDDESQQEACSTEMVPDSGVRPETLVSEENESLHAIRYADAVHAVKHQAKCSRKARRGKKQYDTDDQSGKEQDPVPEIDSRDEIKKQKREARRLKRASKKKGAQEESSGGEEGGDCPPCSSTAAESHEAPYTTQSGEADDNEWFAVPDTAHSEMVLPRGVLV